MKGTITRWLANIPNSGTKEAIRTPLVALADRMSSQATSTAGLVIKTGGSTLAKTGSAAFAGVANGFPVAIAGGTDMPVLTVVITAAKYNVVCFFIDQASSVTAVNGVEGAAIVNIKWPPFPKKKALVGYLIITHSSTFTGGTTALDTATTVYVSPVGAFDPTILI